ncbi:MAG: PEGA domain-containing protein [Actinomycetota bacterium]
MMDPKKLLERLPRFDKDKPFRYLGRRVVQVMAESASANPLLGNRAAPGRYLVVRLVSGAAEREQWEQQFAESRSALLRELEREAQVREIKPRSALDLDLVVVTGVAAERGESERALSTALDPDDVPAAEARLREEREVIIPRRVRTLVIESEPSEAQAYLNDRPVGVTPCRVEDLPEGEHHLVLSRPGSLPYEERLRIEAGRAGQKLVHRVTLQAEPDMGHLEVRTFPPRAQVTIAGETRDSPAKWRLPAGPVHVALSLEEFEPREETVELRRTSPEHPQRVQFRLKYQGPDQDEVVGRLIIYQPGGGPPSADVKPTDTGSNRIKSFFEQADGVDADGWELPPAPKPADAILADRPLRRGVILIGRDDPGGDLRPDVRLFDAENSVTRGCHDWLWIYADRSTGAAYNTFLIGNNSPAGIRVDGSLVMETRRLSDESVIEVGNFRMRFVKETPGPRVEFDF